MPPGAPQANPKMAIALSGGLLTNQSIVLAQLFSPAALLVASVTVGCLGAAVLMLMRSRAQESATPQMIPESAEAPAGFLEPSQAERSLQADMQGTREAAMKATAERLAPLESHELREKAQPEEASLPAPGAAKAKLPSAISGVPSGPGPAAASPLSPLSRAPSVGASALIAEAERLLPAATLPAQAPEGPRARAGRATGGFQPAARFSRSQQAFLRIPVTVTGRGRTGSEFREDTSTVILLPQGAVIHMGQRVNAGDSLTLFNPASQQEAACSVFGVLPGPDGKMLVEMEFTEQQRNFWPVSFPAWSKNGRATPPSRQTSPARAPLPTNSGS